MIIVDTNVIAYTFIAGDHTDLAEAVQTADSSWAAPILWRSEMLSLLTLYVRRKVTPLDEAVVIMNNAGKLLSGNEHFVRSERVLELSSASGHSSYDCEFVALAEDLRVKLVTFDRKLISAFPALAISAAAFVAST